MPSLPAQRRDRTPADAGALAFLSALEEAREAVDEAALRSFVFEVSAGRPQGVIDATDLQIRIDPPNGHRVPTRRRRRLRKLYTPDGDDKRSNDKPADSATAEKTADSQSPQHALGQRPFVSNEGPKEVPIRVRPRSRRRRQALSANIAGMGVNCLVIILLMTGKLPGVAPLDELLWATAPAPELVDFTDVPFEATAEDLPVDGDNDVAAQLLDPGMASFGELETAAALADAAASPTVAAGSIGGELGALFGENGSGLATFDSGLGGAPTAKFFGQEIEGQRIVFVLDNSGSMQGGRLETVITELLRCVDSLREDQEFYVIFHSDTVYPLFYPDPVDRYISPTPANKRRLARWLDTVELCLGDSVDEGRDF